jgi:ketosteroid isomerase-like protein
MSQENIDGVYRAYDAMRRRDLDGFLALMDPEVEGSVRILEVEGRIYRGHEGMRLWAEQVWSVFPDWRPEVEAARAVGEAVIAKVHAAGRGLGSGIATGLTVWQVIRFREGKAIWFQSFETEAEAIEAAELGG